MAEWRYETKSMIGASVFVCLREPSTWMMLSVSQSELEHKGLDGNRGNKWNNWEEEKWEKSSKQHVQKVLPWTNWK